MSEFNSNNSRGDRSGSEHRGGSFHRGGGRGGFGRGGHSGSFHRGGQGHSGGFHRGGGNFHQGGDRRSFDHDGDRDQHRSFGHNGGHRSFNRDGGHRSFHREGNSGGYFDRSKQSDPFAYQGSDRNDERGGRHFDRSGRGDQRGFHRGGGGFHRSGDFHRNGGGSFHRGGGNFHRDGDHRSFDHDGDRDQHRPFGRGNDRRSFNGNRDNRRDFHRGGGNFHRDGDHRSFDRDQHRSFGRNDHRSFDRDDRGDRGNRGFHRDDGHRSFDRADRGAHRNFRRFGANERRDDRRRPVRNSGYRGGDRFTQEAGQGYESQNPYTDRRPGEPKMPKGLEWSMLSSDDKRRLRGLSKEHAENIGLHMLAAYTLEESDPQGALAHAKWIAKQASRVDIARETLGFVAYRQGDWRLAERELRTAYRMNGENDYLPMIADCERGLGHPEKAIEIALSDEAKGLKGEAKAEMMIVFAGAYADQKHYDQALKIVRTLEQVPGLSGAYQMRALQAEQNFLDEAGRVQESEQLDQKADELESQYADEDDEDSDSADDNLRDTDLEDFSEADDSNLEAALGVDSAQLADEEEAARRQARRDAWDAEHYHDDDRHDDDRHGSDEHRDDENQNDAENDSEDDPSDGPSDDSQEAQER